MEKSIKKKIKKYAEFIHCLPENIHEKSKTKTSNRKLVCFFKQCCIYLVQLLYIFLSLSILNI